MGIVGGELVKHPIKCHKENEDKPKAVIASIGRVFRLTARDGITDNDFYREGTGPAGPETNKLLVGFDDSKG